MRRLLWFALLVPLSGCLSVDVTREARNVPLPAESMETLEEGRTDLAECLRVLGAPLAVWEHTEGSGDGAVLAYGWSESLSWGVNVSVPLSRRFSGSIDYDRLDRDLHGVLLFFDQDWVLRRWRKGLLRAAAADLGGTRRSASEVN